MTKLSIGVLLLFAVGFSTGCSGRQAAEPDKATSQQPSSPPESAPAPQAAAQTTAPVADSCFTANTKSQEQGRIELAQAGKEAASENGVRDLTYRALGDSHEYFIIATSAPAWSPQIRAVAQEWSTEYRRDSFKPKFQKALCDVGFSKVLIVAMVPKPSGGGDFHPLYRAYVTKRGFVPDYVDKPTSE